MSNLYPTALNNYLTGTNSPTLASAGHAAEHNALELKLGIDSSSDVNSIDYKLKNTSSLNPGHKHTLANSATDVTATYTELNYVVGVTSAVQTQLDAKVPKTTTVNGHALSSNVTVSASDISLGNVDNTSDATKNSATATLTNKRITKRVGNVSSSSTPTPDADSYDVYEVTALGTGATFGAPTGTPTDGQSLILRVKDDGTARSLDFNAIYRFGDVSKPTTTILSKTLYLGFIYNTADSKWDCVAKVNNL